MKLLRCGSAIALKRFEREAKLAARLVHPGIAQVYAYGVENGQAFLATELIDGESLDTLLRGRGGLPDSVRGRVELVFHIAMYRHPNKCLDDISTI